MVEKRDIVPLRWRRVARARGAAPEAFLLDIPLDTHAERPDPARLLENRLRRAILDLVERRPGLTVGELLAELGMGWGTLHHHLDRLETAGLIHTEQAGRRRLLLPGGASPTAPVARALLAGATCRRIAEAVAREPGIGIPQLLERLGDSQRAVYHHVKRLIAAGLVESERPHRYTSLRATPLLADVLAQEPEPQAPAPRAVPAIAWARRGDETRD